MHVSMSAAIDLASALRVVLRPAPALHSIKEKQFCLTTKTCESHLPTASLAF